MSSRFDIAVRDRLGNLRLAVEVKRRFGADAAWARDTRRNLVDRDPSLRDVPFLLVTPERAYLWTDPSVEVPRELDVRGELAPHFARMGIVPTAVHPSALEALVWSWLDQALSTGTAPAAIEALIPESDRPQVLLEASA
jgi:hypothetical protein